MSANSNSEDKDLRERFATLRREEETQAPDFVVLTARRRRRPVRKFVIIAACVVAILAAALLLRPVPRKPEQGAGGNIASITKWKAPTDFLLETPGRELLRSVPTIGDWRNYSQTSGTQKHPQVRKHALP
jgi:hypothetical protein